MWQRHPVLLFDLSQMPRIGENVQKTFEESRVGWLLHGLRSRGALVLFFNSHNSSNQVFRFFAEVEGGVQWMKKFK